MSQIRPWSSLAFRLALSYGAMMVFTVAVVLAVFYIQIVGVLRNRLDLYANSQLKRLQEYSAIHGENALRGEIDHMLRDGINTDTEIIVNYNNFCDYTIIYTTERLPHSPSRRLKNHPSRDFLQLFSTGPWLVILRSAHRR